MKRVEMKRVRHWERDGKRLNVSSFSLPTGYNPETDKTVTDDDEWGWFDYFDSTHHARLDLAKTHDDVWKLLKKWGYAIDGPSKKPDDSEGRICFGIDWYDNLDDAMARHREVRDMGRTYNGGFFDGMPCGRDSAFDYDHKGTKMYAVTN